MELYVSTRADWRAWLEKYHLSEEEIWLIYYKKPSGKPRILYGDAVEEALCFGWIDGKIKKINEDYYVQRFTPRRKGSRWSRYNIERVKRMIHEGRMQPAGLYAFKETLEKPELIYDNSTGGDPEIPVDLEAALMANNKAYDNFLHFTPTARRMYLEWLNGAKRPETRARRIEKLIGIAENNIRPGF